MAHSILKSQFNHVTLVTVAKDNRQDKVGL